MMGTSLTWIDWKVCASDAHNGIVTLFAVLVAVYKIYNSTKGKAKFGNDFTFEWS
jgi:hypothetical protein